MTEIHGGLGEKGQGESSPLRVLFDGHWLVSGPPSGKNVLQGLVHGWIETFPDDEITIKVPEGAPRDFEGAVSAKVVSGIRASNHAINVITTRPNRRQFDLYISQNFGAILGSSLKTSFLHDGIYKEHPKWFSWRERLYLALIRPTLFRNPIIFTSSKAEARRIERIWPRLKGKVLPVGLAVPYGLTEATSTKPAKLPEAAGPFLLVVGRLNIRKNLAKLIEAYSRSSLRDELDLYVVGEANGLSGSTISDLAGVHFLGGVSDSELRWLYENASAFVFPSLDEGFGLPLVEAAYFGVPIAASDIPPFHEAEVVDVFFDPKSVEDMTRALEGLVRVNKKPAYTQQTDWPTIVAAIRRRVRSELEMVRR